MIHYAKTAMSNHSEQQSQILLSCSPQKQRWIERREIFFSHYASFPNTRPLPTRPCIRHHVKSFTYFFTSFLLWLFSTSGYTGFHLKANNELETLLHKSINNVPILW